MHPQLAEHTHKRCVEFIQALQRCHDENPKSKFMGACNAAKDAMSECLRDERADSRVANAEKAKKRKEALKKRLEAQR
eukprot:m.63862 g.63862  ORF g.63862 m.63862 type:complete len:78 (-) comp13981_c0_seq5:2329-2562(-)